MTNRQDETQATGTSLSEPKQGWSCFAKWVLATVAGFGVGAGLTGFVGDRVALAVGEVSLAYVPWGFVIIGLGVGGTLGAMQWLVLRQRVSQAVRQPIPETQND